MQTTYDNSWMYPNSRHDNVQNTQKNDSYSYAVLTDRYTNIQTGSHPREPDNIIAPQNNAASSLQNDQQRTAATNWPTSNYFQSSYTDNIYTENTYTPQTSNLNYLSQNTQSQQICDIRYPQTHNVDFTHTPSNSHVSTVISGSNDNTPRIRVKDVFSLNNNSLHDPFLSSHSHQTYSKTQDDYFTNYGRKSYNKTEISEAQSEFIDIQKLSLTQAGPSLSYTQRQQFCNTSNTIYQGSGEYSTGNQLQSGRSRVIAVDLGEKAQNSQTDSSDVCCGDVRDRVMTNRTSAEINSLEVGCNRRLIQRIPISGNNAQQHNICDTTEANLFIHNSVTTSTNAQYQTTTNRTTPNQTTTNQTTTNRTTNHTTTNRTTTNQTTPNQATHTHNQLNRPQTTIKISIPQTGKSSVINMNTTGNTKDSSSLSLPCLLESNNIYISPGNKEGSNQVSGKEKSFTLSLPQPVQESLNNTQSLAFVSDVNNSFLSPGQSQRVTDNTFRNTVITSQRNIPRTTDPLIDVNRENIIRFLNSTSSTSIGNYSENVPRQIVFKGSVLSSSLTSTPEKMDKNVENMPDNCVSEGNIFEQNIKMEEYTIEDSPDDSLQQECESQISIEEKLPTLSLIDDDEPLVGFTDAEDPESCIEESGILEGRSSARSNTVENGCQVQQERAGLNQDNYKSEINRDKLHMLIQFIKKEDEEPVGPCSSRSLTNKISDNNNKDKGADDLNHNRRKLSKTSLVKNKNNLRDMVALNKIARAELLKSSSSSPLTSSGCDTNSEKSEGGKTEGNVQYNPSKENSTQKEDSLKSDSFNMNRSIKQQVGCSSGMLQKRKRNIQEERDVTHMMRALRVIPEYFCMSCNLSSPMSSFWINVVSSELRCITCFEKMALKSNVNIPKSKTSRSDGTLSEKGSAEKGKAVNEKSQERVGSLGEKNKPEQSKKQKTIKSKHGSSKDDKTFEKAKAREAKAEKSGEQTGKKSNVKEDTHKVKSSEISSKTSTCGKKKRKDSTSSEEIVEKPKKTKISSKENSTSSKSHSSNHSKQVLEPSGKKAKENLSSHKERNAEHSKSSKTKSRSPSKECCTCHKMKSSEQSNSSETKSKSTSSSNSEKNKQTEQSRKRKNSEEDCIPSKVRIVEGHSKKEIKQMQQPTEKSKVSKDETVSHKSKVLDNDKSKSSSEKSRRHSSTKEDENLRKDRKQVCDSSDKSKSSHHKIKTSESIKQKEKHSTDEKVGKKTKENLESQKPGSSKEHTKSETKQSAESSGGHTKKNQKQEPVSGKKEGKQGSSGVVIKEKSCEKEKEMKQFVGKIPKLTEKNKPRKVRRAPKDETWTPSKEKNRKTKSASSSEKLKNRESQEGKTEKKAKETTEKKAKETTEKKAKETTEKKAKETTEKRSDANAEKNSAKKNQTEKRYAEDSEDSSDSETSKKETQSLLKKLMKKTRKLSLTLLKEA